METFKYPANIGSDDSTKYRCITFVILETNEDLQKELTDQDNNALASSNTGSGSSATVGSDIKSTVGGITLPLPNSISDNQSHNWELQEGLIAGASEGIQSSIESLSDRFGFKIDAAKTFKYISSHASSRQFTANPGYWEMYKGSSPRSFSFVWNFVPTSASESEIIQGIILAFKKYSSPQGSSDSMIFQSPYVWNITTTNQHITQMLAPHDLVCKNVTVDFSEGSMPLFKDGMPKHVTLTLTFEEVMVNTASDYGHSEFSAFGAIQDATSSLMSTVMSSISPHNTIS